jgi:hypothetical protein
LETKLHSFGGIFQTVLAPETLYATFRIDNLLVTGIEGVVARPHIYVQFRLSSTHGHDFLTVAENLGFGVPSRMNVSFSHNFKESEMKDKN